MLKKMIVLSVLLVFSVSLQAEEKSEWITLFNGKDLDGWKQVGGKAKYEVVDGVIVGTTAEGQPNSFLSKGPYANFILEFEVDCHKDLNSGCQIRSQIYQGTDTEIKLFDEINKKSKKRKKVMKKGDFYGYQCEVSPKTPWRSGHFWDEARRRQWLDSYDPDDKTQKHAYKVGEWNKYRIEAVGNKITSYINGQKVAEFTDEMDASGHIGLQVHSIRKGTGPYWVKFRNIRIKLLK